MSSQISGNVGSSNSGAIVSAFLMDGRVCNGTIGSVAPGAATLITSDVASGTGAFTLKGLAQGTYQIVAVKTSTPPGGGAQVQTTLNSVLITVDGSSNYSI